MQADATAEDRLESALERIAKRVSAPHASALEAAAATEAVAQRLDRIIGTLRDALGK